MNDSAARIDLLKDIIVDQDFESVCPPLTEDEFSLLEQNILSDGEVTSPLIVWNNNLIDGHHRRQIILQHVYSFALLNLRNLLYLIPTLCG